MTPDIAVLEHLARQAPPLPGARCKGRPEDFDTDDPEDPRTASAIADCRNCPALIACRRWLAALPKSERPAGVVAGRLVRPYRPRPSSSRAAPARRRVPMRDHCCDWLKQRLADGPVEVALIAVEARRLGWSKSLAYKARDRLGLRTSGGYDRDHPAVWHLPDGELQPQEKP